MGYRALLKNYIRHLLRVTGDHYIEAAGEGGALTKRDLAELRLLVAEAQREDERQPRREADRGPLEHPASGEGNVGNAGAG